ncbi:unnamed protein product, partial [Polarella glacialis]
QGANAGSGRQRPTPLGGRSPNAPPFDSTGGDNPSNEPSGFERAGSPSPSPTALRSGAWDEESTVLRAGESFGELALLYNTRREATFRAKEDAVVYA